MDNSSVICFAKALSITPRQYFFFLAGKLVERKLVNSSDTSLFVIALMFSKASLAVLNE